MSINLEHDKELLKGNTPTLILAVLEENSLHGYAIAREIERRSGDALKFKEGTLYPALHTLEKDGLISGSWIHQDGARSRKVYTITEAGSGALRKKTEMWTNFSAAISKVIQGGETNEPAIPNRTGQRGKLSPELATGC